VLAPVPLPARQETSSASESCDDDQDEEGDDADDGFCTGWIYQSLALHCKKSMLKLFQK